MVFGIEGNSITTRAMAVLLVLIMGFGVVPGVIFGHPAVENAAAASKIVKIGQLSEILIWNPMTIDMTEDFIACYLMYSELFTYDQDWGGPVGDLALTWNQTTHPDNTMTTWINITHNAYFHGKNATGKADPRDTSHPLHASDVVFTYNLIMNNEGGAWNTYLEGVTSVVAVDDYTVRIDTESTKSTLIDDLSNIPIVPEYLWNDPDSPQYSNPYMGMNPSDNIGSGPFVFDSWLKASWYKFMAVPSQYYHASQDYGRVVQIDGVLYTVYSDTQALALAMNQGIEDVVVMTGDVNVFRNVLGGAGTKVHVIKQVVNENGITDIAINAIPASVNGNPTDFRTSEYAKGNPVLQDPFVRQAIMMTLNKDYIVNNIMYGLATKADSVVQPGYWHKTIQNQVQFDPAAAKSLLIAHGYSDINGDNILEATSSALSVQNHWVTVGTPLSGIRVQAPNTDPSWGVMAETWAGWASQAGIGMVASVENEGTMDRAAWYNGDYDIWVWHWGWGPEPLGSDLSVWKTDQLTQGGDNVQMPMGPWWFGVDNATASPTGEPYSAFDENFTAAVNTLDKADRKAIVDKLQQWVYDSYCENPPVYDLGLYGYTDYRYEGWGDWVMHPGRTVYSDMLWLWFDLKSAANHPAFFNQPLDASYDILQGTPKTFSVTVSDSDSDPLVVNWTFGDGTSAQNTLTGDTSVPSVVSQTHTYSTLGNALTLNVSVWDHVSGHEVKVPATVNVLSSPNLGPVIRSMTFSPSQPVYVGTQTTWTATALDAESGTSGQGLLFTWTWGDGTYTVHHVSTLANGVPYTDSQTHTWNILGAYDVTVSVWDGFDVQQNALHNVTTSLPYTVSVNTQPSAPVISTIDFFSGLPVNCSAISTDADADQLSFTWDWGGGDYSVTTHEPSPGVLATSTVLHTWATDGDYPVTVYVDDGHGHNVSSSAVAHISSAGTEVPPCGLRLAMYPNPGIANNEVWINISASDANRDPLTFYVDLGDWVGLVGAATAGGTDGQQYVNISYTYADDGRMPIIVYVNDSFPDGSHNVTGPFDVSVLPENSAPDFTLQSHYTAFYNKTITAAPVTISDPDSDTLAVWYDWGDDTGLSEGNATYVGSHVYKALGTFTLTVAVNDSQGHNVTQSREFTVTDANLMPDIMTFTYEPLRAKNYVGDKFWFNVTVKDFEGDPADLVISFGDGTPAESIHLTLTPDTNSSVQTFEHNFSAVKVDGYAVVVSVSDGMDHFNMTPKQSKATIVISEKPGKGGLSLAVIGAVVVVVAAIALLLAFLMMRRKKMPERAEEGGMEGMAPPEAPPPPPKS